MHNSNSRINSESFIDDFVIGRLESIKIETETLQCDEIDRSLICMICQEILKIPLECTTCKNNFCKKCIENWLSKNNSCPFRCQGRNLLKKPHSLIIQLLNSLSFNCKNKANGCEETFDYNGYLKHMEKCLYNPIKCHILKCEKEVLLKDYEKHLNYECEFNIHVCKMCGYETMGPTKYPHECNQHAHKCYVNLKSGIEGLLMKTDSKLKDLEVKFQELIKIVESPIE